MSYIAWSDKLSMGVPEIDAQHKRLLDIINRFLAALDQGHGDEAVETALRDMRDYTRVHFEDEEKFIERIGFPYLEDHRQEHQMLTAKIGAQLSRMLADKPSVKEVHVFLKSWLVDHLLGWDFNIVEYLEQAKK